MHLKPSPTVSKLTHVLTRDYVTVLMHYSVFVGNVNSLDWSDGMDYWSGLLDWTTGVGGAQVHVCKTVK